MDDKGIRLKEKISTEVWERFCKFRVEEDKKAMNDLMVQKVYLQ